MSLTPVTDNLRERIRLECALRRLIAEHAPSIGNHPDAIYPARKRDELRAFLRDVLDALGLEQVRP